MMDEKCIFGVGVMRTCFGEKFGVPRQPGLSRSAWGEIEFSREFASMDAVRGLEKFSHLWVIFGFHETEGRGYGRMVRPPRLGGNERVGVFASRATHRPNGLGLSLVELEEVCWEEGRGPVVRVRGVDLVDGTPIYDIKPYLPFAEARVDACGSFAEREQEYLRVEVAEGWREDWEGLSERVRGVLGEVLSLDPRPAVQRDEREFGVRLCGMNVRFVVRGGICEILSFEESEGSGLKECGNLSKGDGCEA